MSIRPLELEILDHAAVAVQQHDRLTRAALDIVKANTVDVDEMPGRGVVTFGLPRQPPVRRRARRQPSDDSRRVGMRSYCSDRRRIKGIGDTRWRGAGHHQLFQFVGGTEWGGKSERCCGAIDQAADPGLVPYFRCRAAKYRPAGIACRRLLGLWPMGIIYRSIWPGNLCPIRSRVGHRRQFDRRARSAPHAVGAQVAERHGPEAGLDVRRIVRSAFDAVDHQVVDLAGIGVKHHGAALAARVVDRVGARDERGWSAHDVPDSSPTLTPSKIKSFDTR